MTFTEYTIALVAFGVAILAILALVLWYRNRRALRWLDKETSE